MSVSIVIPAYNESISISSLLKNLKSVCPKNYEIIVVNDGSTDETASIVKEIPGIKLISYKLNRGKAFALKIGFKKARYDTVATMDADGTHLSEDLIRLVKTLDGYDMVVGSRFLNNMFPENIPFHRSLTNTIGSYVASLILGERVTDVTSGMRIFRKKILESIDVKAKNLDFEPEFTSRTIRNNFKYNEINIYADVPKGESNLKFVRDVISFFIAILRGKFR